MTRLDRAFAAIDAANADDPNTLVVDGRLVPKEQTHAEMATRWVQALDPSATDAQLLAARAHHLRRWELPRGDYPDGRRGYLRWRTEQKRRHSEALATILGELGYETDVVERVQQLVLKQGLGRDPAVQVHEDALCLVFLETQLDDLITRLGEEHTIEVVRKTAAKMSDEAKAAAGELGLSEIGRKTLVAATS